MISSYYTRRGSLRSTRFARAPVDIPIIYRRLEFCLCPKREIKISILNDCTILLLRRSRKLKFALFSPSQLQLHQPTPSSSTYCIVPFTPSYHTDPLPNSTHPSSHPTPTTMSAPNLRARKSEKPSSSAAPLTTIPPEPPKKSTNDNTPPRLSILDVLRVLGGLFLLSSTLSYFITRDSILWGWRPPLTRVARIQAWLVHNFPPSPPPQIYSTKLHRLPRLNVVAKRATRIDCDANSMDDEDRRGHYI